VCRNPLAEPGILGITGGAGLAAVLVIVFLPGAEIWMLSNAAAIGALIAFAIVYGCRHTAASAPTAWSSSGSASRRRRRRSSH
jgi:ABC-type Fe3+-siderophore transport system permease subunit